MRKITFRFPNERSLKQFTAIVDDKFMQISFEELTVTCDCGEAEVELAVKGFNAKVINKELRLD